MLVLQQVEEEVVGKRLESLTGGQRADEEESRVGLPHVPHVEIWAARQRPRGGKRERDLQSKTKPADGG